MAPAEFAKRRSKIEHTPAKSTSWRRRALQKLIRDARAVAVMSGGAIIGWQMLNGQIVCVKQRYRNEQTATFYLQMIRALSTHAVIPQRAYFCATCCGWHLTSRA